MTIEQCYQELGGSYAEVCGRLPSPRLVEKFARKFLDDPSCAELTAAMAAGDHDAAFRAAHTLKGVAANLSFTRLCASAGALTELLRTPADTIPPEAALLMEAVTRDYNATTAAIRALD
ncbi:MAG: Hpt domain-containing protein [Eubacteriales bacterium]|nr:Hpt domain-containing protein [Eubacteriales bacterium]